MDRKSKQQQVEVPSIEREVVVYQYGDSPRKILLVHGWSGRGTQMAVLAKRLLREGYGVVSFDAPAHGKAPGRTSMMPYFIETMHFLNKKLGPFEGVIGHSLGGMSSLKAVSEGLETKKLVIIGTANSITNITREFVQNMQMNGNIARRMKKHFDQKFGEDMDNYSGAVSAEGVNIPTLVIHDEQDVDVPVKAAYEIDEKLKNSRLFITQKLGHRKILGNKEVIDKIIGFLAV